MHLLEAGPYQVLLDCGRSIGAHPFARPGQVVFPFQPAQLDAVIVSHAHVDHCGNLPNLIRQGFTGPVFCTPATRDLLALVLGESARFEEADARVHSILGKPDEAGNQAFFTRRDVHQLLDQCRPLAYEHGKEILPGIQLRLVDAGHILGSAMTSLTMDGPGKATRITFTGDLGRPALRFLRPPAPIPAGNLLVSECTYGGRWHQPVDQMLARLREVLLRCREGGGKVLIPAFSLGRTQLVVHYLEEGFRSGQFPALPLFVDSPLAAAIGEVQRRYPEALIEADGAGATPQRAHFVHSLEESEELNQRKDPCIIVASGGMCEGGRIQRYLPHHIDDPRCTVILVSYQAPHSLGRRLLERGPRVRFRGRSWNKWADVVELSGFSGHADHDDLLAFLRPLAGAVAKVRLVHGELEQAQALAQALRTEAFADVGIPALGEMAALE